MNHDNRIRDPLRLDFPGRTFRRRAGAFSRAAVIMLGVCLSASLLVAGQRPADARKSAQALAPAERRLSTRVRVETVREVTTKLASPAMEGRGTATPGGEKAAGYLAQRFSELGLKPLGDTGSYLQAVKFKAAQVLPDSMFRAGDVALKYGRDFVFSPPNPADGTSVSGDLVFVGYGVSNTDLHRDDFAGLDLKGKVVVVLRGKPNGVDEAAWRKASNRQALFTAMIMRQPAAVVVTNASTKEQPYEMMASYLTRRRVVLSSQPGMSFKTPPVLVASDEGAELIFAGAGITYRDAKTRAEAGDFVSRSLSKPAVLTVHTQEEEAVGSNVVGELEGGDPSLKSQAVVFSAHYDAYGKGMNGEIYPGAADNALGVGMMLAIAEAFSRGKLPPRRSLIFMAVTGEEHGLLGAEYWVSHPTWPLDKLAADVNFDGIGTETYGHVRKVVGFGSEYSDLGDLLKSVAAATGNEVVPDPLPEEQAFYRSDHYSFVKKGVPALMLLGAPDLDMAQIISRAKAWLATDYHQTGDTVRKDWNWEGPRRLAVVGLIVGWRVANAEAMPGWLASAPFHRTSAAGAR